MYRRPGRNLSSIYKSPKTERGKRCEEIRHKRLKDLINKAINKGYIAYNDSFSGYLITNREGREVLNFFYLVEATAKEFGYTASIIASIFIGIWGTLLVLLFT